MLKSDVETRREFQTAVANNLMTDEHGGYYDSSLPALIQYFSFSNYAFLRHFAVKSDFRFKDYENIVQALLPA